MRMRMRRGKTMRRRPKSITGIRGRGAFIKNWSKQQPGYHDRTVMMKKCGKKCFLGPRKTFPVCTRNTCKINRKGIYAAYMRAKEYITIKGKQKYRQISAKARKMLYASWICKKMYDKSTTVVWGPLSIDWSLIFCFVCFVLLCACVCETYLYTIEGFLSR